MNAIILRSVAALACALIVVVAGAVAGVAHANARRDGDAVEAVWKIQQITLRYRSEHAFYTCAGFRERLKSMLVALGAHESMAIDVRGCDRASSVVRATATFLSPVEATAQNLQELTTYGATVELIARTKGVRLPEAHELQRFSAEWKIISFSDALNLRLSTADCELLKVLRRDAFPTLAVRVVRNRLHCPEASTIIRPDLTVAALVATPQSRARPDQ